MSEAPDGWTDCAICTAPTLSNCMALSCPHRPPTPAETYETRGPRCPYCQHMERDLEAFHYDESTTELECGSCGKLFAVSVYSSTSWRCKPIAERKAPHE